MLLLFCTQKQKVLMFTNYFQKVLTKPFIGYNIITRVSTRTLRVLIRKGGGKDAW